MQLSTINEISIRKRRLVLWLLNSGILISIQMGKDILDKILSGLSDKNIRFEDLKKMLAKLGFDCRIKGDHHIFSKEEVEEIINLQPLKDGKAKPYQVKQVRGVILKYKLHKGATDV